MTNGASLKLIIVGLDGADWDIARPLMERGEMPALKSIVDDGASGPLRSVTPPVSAVAWGAFMTGMSPAGTGAMGFGETDIRRYEYHLGIPLNSKPWVGRTFWDMMGSAGLKTAVVGVPATFPAWKVNGVMVSGFPAPQGSADSFFPAETADWATGPINLEEGAAQGGATGDFIKANRDMADNVLQLVKTIVDKTAPEILAVVFSEIDKIQHRFLGDAGPGESRMGDVDETLISFYRDADRRLGELLALAPDDCAVIVLSDHGGGPSPTKFVNINAWLADKGFFTPTSKAGASPAVETLKNIIRSKIPRAHLQKAKKALRGGGMMDVANWSATRAYCSHIHVPCSAIIINLEGRQPKGIVGAGEKYESLRTEIIKNLSEITDPQTGARVVKSAWRREELFSGPHIENVPDIIIEFFDGYRSGYAASGSFVSDIPEAMLRSHLGGGTHRMDGAFAARGACFKNGFSAKTLRMMDVAPTICHAAGFPVPENFEGAVMTEIFSDEFLAANPPTAGPALAGAADAAASASEDDLRSMEKKLEGFGYL